MWLYVTDARIWLRGDGSSASAYRLSGRCWVKISMYAGFSSTCSWRSSVRPTASNQRRKASVCLASSNTNCVRYISSANRPSAAIAATNGWRSWVTDSSPAMNWAASDIVHQRSRSVIAATSRASWVKSMSAGFQCFALPLVNNRIGNESKFRPPLLSVANPVRLPWAMVGLPDIDVLL